MDGFWMGGSIDRWILRRCSCRNIQDSHISFSLCDMSDIFMSLLKIPKRITMRRKCRFKRKKVLTSCCDLQIKQRKTKSAQTS